MLPRCVSNVVRSPLMKASSPPTMQRRMLQSTAPFGSTTQSINQSVTINPSINSSHADHHNLLAMPYTELVAFTRGFLTETGYRMPEHRSTLIAQSLIDAFAKQEHDGDGAHKLRFMHSLSSLVNDGESANVTNQVSVEANGTSNTWSKSVVFEDDYSVDQLLLDSLPTLKGR